MKTTLMTFALAALFTAGGAGLLWGAHESFAGPLKARAEAASIEPHPWLVHRDTAPTLEEHLRSIQPRLSFFGSPSSMWAHGMSMTSNLPRPEEWAIQMTLGGEKRPDADPHALLTSADPERRLEGVEAIIHRDAMDHLPALEKALADEDIRVAGMAALALALAGTADALRMVLHAPFMQASAVDPYAESYRLGSARMQWRRAAAHLGRAHPGVLREVMWNGAPEDQLRAALAASRAGRVRGEEGAAALHAVLEDGLEHPERKVRQFAAAGLAALEAPGAVEALAGMLRRRGEGAGGLVDIGTAESRAAVTGLLQEMETWGPEAAGRLKRYLAAGEPFVASQAARVLARLQPPGTESALVEGLQAAELDVALVCAEGLSDMGAVERLPRLLAMVSERGHGYLAALKLDPGGAYAGFRELWHSPDPAVRARALRAMSAARKASDLRLFMEATHSADPGIRASAVGALSQFPGRNETTKRIIAMLDDGDPQVRRVARWVCQHLRRPEFAAPLLAQGAGGKYSDAARGAISSIAGVAPEELQILRWQALGFNIGGSVSLGIGLLLFALGAGPPVSAWLRRRHARGA